VTVDVTDFSAQPTGQSALVAQWSIFKGEGKEALLSRKTRLGAAVGRQDYAAMVAAMSQSVADLSREIAAGLRMLASRTATRYISYAAISPPVEPSPLQVPIPPLSGGVGWGV
jgi:hypothetical protein